MHGNTFHSLWMLQAEQNASALNASSSMDEEDEDDLKHQQEDEEAEHDSSAECAESSSSSDLYSSIKDELQSADGARSTQPQLVNGIISSAYCMEDQTPKSQLSFTAGRGKRHLKQYILSNVHLILLLVTSSVNALMVKVFCVFSGFIYRFYDISFTTLTLILGLSTLSTMLTVFINPYIMYLRCNILIFVVQSVQIVGIMIIITFQHYIPLTLGVILIFNTYQIHWGVANTMISCFIQPVNNEHKSKIKHAAATKRKYLTIFNTQWTIATLYFYIVGVVSQSASFVGFLSFTMAIGIVLAVLNCVMLPKQPALPPHFALAQHLNTHNQLYDEAPNSFATEVRSLCCNVRFMSVCIGFMLVFFIWGWFYVTFGPFIQTLYHFDSMQFGAYTAIVEALGNGIAMISYIYFSSIFVSNSNPPSSSNASLQPKCAYLETECLLLFAVLILFVSLLFLSLLTHLEAFLLSNEIVVALVIILYFIGHEGCVIGLMILHVEVTPTAQQPRASGIVSMINCLAVFISQSIIIGPLDSKFYRISFKLESIILCFFSFVLLAVTVVLFFSMHKARNQKIMQHVGLSQSNLAYNQQYNAHSVNTPILNGKSYTYHSLKTLRPAGAGATDLLYNDNINYRL